MKIFISSVIAGLEDFRDAADRAVLTLGHEVIRAEQFGASPETPQRTCLAGVREADVVILLLGSRYGAVQESGMSATHEEYMEAGGRSPVLVFVHHAEDMEDPQKRFLQELQEWESGHYTVSFEDTDDLSAKVIRALHDHELLAATGPVDEGETLARAIDTLGRETQTMGREASLVLAVAGSPKRRCCGLPNSRTRRCGRT